MQSLIHFIYLGSYESHSDITLRYLEKALNRFHRHKHYVAASGVRSGAQKNDSFNIAKIELMQHVSRFIKQLGSVPQFSSEQTERLHKDMPKFSFKRTNQVNYPGQMCRFLDRQERILLFSCLVDWHCEPDKSLLFQEMAGKYLPTLVRDVFGTLTSILSETTAFVLRRTPDHTNLSPQDIQNMYELPHFQNDLHRFLYDRTYIAPWHAITPVACISTWSRVRMQLK